MRGFLGFIVNDILSQPAVIAGLMAMIGLIALRKPLRTIITGTLKTIVGFLILGVGAEAIVQSLNPLGEILNRGFGIQGLIPNNEAIVGVAVKTLGQQTALIMSLGFLFNLLFARITPFKYVFLTGHHTFFMACLLSAVLTAADIRGTAAVLIGSVLLGLLMVGIPALAQPFMRRITGDDNLAIGHFGTFGYVSAALIGKWFGNPEKSTEDLKVPQGLSFLRDTTVSTALTMVLTLCDRGVAGGTRRHRRGGGGTALPDVCGDAGIDVRRRTVRHFGRGSDDAGGNRPRLPRDRGENRSGRQTGAGLPDHLQLRPHRRDRRVHLQFCRRPGRVGDPGGPWGTR